MNPLENQTPIRDLNDDFETELQLPRSQRPWLWLLLTLLLAGGSIAVWRVLTPSAKPPVATAAAPPGVKVKLSSLQASTIEQSSKPLTNARYPDNRAIMHRLHTP